MAAFAESVVEEAVLDLFRAVDYLVIPGPESPPSLDGLRKSYGDVVLDSPLSGAVARLNPTLPPETVQDALRRLTHPEGASLEDRNRAFHRMLVDGVTVEHRRADGSIAGAQARVLDFADARANDFMVMNQLTVIENRHQRRLDLVVFVNGLPLALIELKNAVDENATIWNAYQQLQTYRNELPTLFGFNELLVISDGLEARMGTLTAGREWFKPWRTIAGEDLAPTFLPEIKVLVPGIFEKQRLLDLLRNFVVFEDAGSGPETKKVAGYHQFHAVRVAVQETLRAAELRDPGARAAEGRYESGTRPGGDVGDRRIGVVWHTQGSGKSLTMAFYAGRIIREPAMQNPTIVVLTDRNDLDDQLFGTFTHCQDLLRQPPVQAESRADLRSKLSVQAGGVVFTTVQKFLPEQQGDRHPMLSDRRNIVVIADEAHRSQYDFIDGYARHMRDALPNASFIGFTGTPIELTDKNTRAVFGDYISIYDVLRSVEDKATVPIYYESRLARLALDEAERPRIDQDFQEVTEGEEVERRDRLASKWAQLESVVGADRRISMVAQDIVGHYEQRLETLEGKAMVVCMSRRIAVELYRALVQLRPDWHGEDDDRGAIKVVMTGSAADPPDWQRHIRSKRRREDLADRFRDPDDSLRMVIVRDMWLTGFDAPSLHTMYLDKPMRGHGLMQAIARVNRVFKDKPGGLVVDYLGLAHELKQALATYTRSGGTGESAIPIEQAATVMIEKYEICRGMLHGFEWSPFFTGNAGDRVDTLMWAQDHLLGLKDGKERFVSGVNELSRAFALVVPHEEAMRIRDDVGFFQHVRAGLLKRTPTSGRLDEDLNTAVRQIVSRAVAPDGVMDIFAAAGLDRPDISILSDQFLAEVRGMPQRNLAVDLLQKLLVTEIRARGRRNVVEARSFAAMLEQALRRYQNRAIEAAQVIEELIDLARQLREAERRGEQLGLTDDELAFYDALETNDSAVAVLGDETLRDIARELVESVRSSVTIDWEKRENVRAQLRVLVKRILRKHGYPPDKQEKATQTVLQQAEVLSELWLHVPDTSGGVG